MRHYEKPLNPDAFTSWGLHDPNLRAQNMDVLAATLYLHKFVIVKFAQTLDKEHSTDLPQPKELIVMMHRNGINARHLGQVRMRVQNVRLRDLLLLEMYEERAHSRARTRDCRSPYRMCRVARVIKSTLNQRMRDTMKLVNGMSQEAFKTTIIDTFNRTLKNDEFWSEIQRNVQLKFWCGISNQSGLMLVCNAMSSISLAMTLSTNDSLALAAGGAQRAVMADANAVSAVVLALDRAHRHPAAATSGGAARA